VMVFSFALGSLNPWLFAGIGAVVGAVVLKWG